jgi:hypothetical protein
VTYAGETFYVRAVAHPRTEPPSVYPSP